ncbi:MAG: L,D-transpeptidase family protein [Polyangiaceae bacterium]|nr:L,D-transpeptidase family protein [Polyangiaceae bacterium]
MEYKAGRPLDPAFLRTRTKKTAFTAALVLCVCAGTASGCSNAPAPVKTAGAPRPTANPTTGPAFAPTSAAQVNLPVADPAASATPTDAPNTPTQPEAPQGPRLTSQGYITFIYRRPKVDALFIGYVRHGQSVAIKSTQTVPGVGCSGGFYAIEPHGYVCNDRTVTLQPNERFVAAARATDPVSGPFPYKYALSNGSPMYNRIPTKDEQTRFERTYGPVGKWIPLHKSVAAHGDLATFDPIAAVDPVPSVFLDKRPADPDKMGLIRQTIPLGSMLSYTKVFEAEGRTWLLSVDQTLVPADRMRPFKPSSFHGTKLGGDTNLPIAWMRKTAKPKYKKTEGGQVESAGAEWGVRTFVGLTGQKVTVDGKVYLETVETAGQNGKYYIAEADATVAEAKDKLPFGLDMTRTWIHVSISKGTLVAYRGLTPEYATLMSPGKGGIPQKGRDNVDNATTPTGTYNITFKDRAATMSPETGENRSFWIQDVPWTQYFNPPFALHAAFWHERFGEPTSAGCVNVAPIDAEWLFEWSEPKVPAGWQGATGAGATSVNGPVTAVVVQR